MFDPHDYFDIRHNRAVCPVHGNKDRNLQIKRHKANDKWVFNCYSHNCTLKDIALAAGFNAKDIYDHHEPYIDISQYVSTINKPIPQPTTTIEQKVEDTFGPNPCTQLELEHEDGSTIGLMCNGKRCIHCGPRKKMTIQLQLQEGLGTNAYVARSNDLEDINRSLATTKKACQREGRELRYQIVGDKTLGWIVASNVQILEHQRITNLSDWIKRILDIYHHAVQRIRRSYVLGRVSLVHIKRSTTNSGQRSQWSFVSHYYNDRTAQMEEEIARRDDLVNDTGWHVWEEGRKLVSTLEAWK